MRTTRTSQGHQHFLTSCIAFVLGAIVLVMAGCKTSPTGPSEPTPTQKIFTIGTKTEISSLTVPTTGGVLTLSGTGLPLSGLTVTIPKGSYTDARNFSISTAAISSSTLPSDLTVLGPTITIQNGGGYSDSAMIVKIPVTIPAGTFAGAFFYNESTGELEALPINEETSTSLTIATRHFSTSNLTVGATRSGGIHATNMAFSDIVILAMDETKLFALGSANSGFTPGTDDWEFTNLGSYIAAGGHCAGQSMTAMWYYYEQKAIEGKGLYHAFDPDPLVAQDNRLGYRFASTIQADFNFSGWIQHVSFQSWFPPLTFKTFLLAIHVTKQPQSLLMYASKDTAGHAMVVFGVQVSDKLNGTLEIADPNRPGKVSEIKYVNGVLQPYVTGLRADGTPVSFDRIGMGGKSTYLNWPQIGVRWAEFKAKTIGNIAPHAFPQTTLQYYDPDLKAIVTMPSSFSLNSDSLHWFLDTPQGLDAGCNFFKPDGTEIAAGSVIPLTYGQNIIGFWTRARSPKTHNYEYVDFVWDTVYSSQLLIDPEEMTGTTGKSYTWWASAGTIPNSARYEWDFGDGTAKVLKYNEGSCSHTYASDGIYTVTLTLFDNSNNKKLGQTTAKATIGGLWPLLHQTNVINASFASTFNYSDGRQDPTTWTFPSSAGGTLPLLWKDTTFTATIYKETYRSDKSFDSEICIIKGTMLSDGLTMKSVTVYDRIVSSVYAIAGNLIYSHEYVKSFNVTNAVGKDVNFGQPPQYVPSFTWLSDVDKMVSNVRDDYTSTDFDPTTGKTTVTTRHLTSISWGSALQPDVLSLLIYKQ